MFVRIKYYDSVNCVNRFIPWLILANSPASLAHTKGYAWKRNEGDKDINSPDRTDRKPMSLRIPAASPSAKKLDSPINPQTWPSRKVIRE